MFRAAVGLIVAFCLSAVTLAGDITVRGRNLSDDPNIPPVQNLRITVINSAGVTLVNNQPFQGDTGTVTFGNNQLNQADKTVRLVVQSDGRLDAIIDTLFGEATHNLEVTLPIRPPVAAPQCQPCYRRGFFRRCR